MPEQLLRSLPAQAILWNRSYRRERGEKEVELAVTHVLETGFFEISTHNRPRSVVDRFFNGCDDHVEHGPTDYIVAKSVDDHKPSAGTNHTPHFVYYNLLMWVVMK